MEKQQRDDGQTTNRCACNPCGCNAPAKASTTAARGCGCGCAGEPCQCGDDCASRAGCRC